MVNIGLIDPEICIYRDRQTYIHTYTHIYIAPKSSERIWSDEEQTDRQTDRHAYQQPAACSGGIKAAIAVLVFVLSIIKARRRGGIACVADVRIIARADQTDATWRESHTVWRGDTTKPPTRHSPPPLPHICPLVRIGVYRYHHHHHYHYHLFAQ